MIRSGLSNYLSRFRLFQRNARLYLLSVIIAGVAAGIFSLLLNFHVLQLGLDQAFLGQLLSINSLAYLVASLPAGYLSDHLGRKLALLIAGLGSVLAIAGIAFAATASLLAALALLLGLFQSLSSVTMAPFLAENSSEKERNYLFSAGFSVQMLAVTLGYWLGGRLPDWLARLPAIGTGAGADYSGALLIVAALNLIALLPLLLLHARLRENLGDRLAPLRYARRQATLLTRLITPLIVTNLGAGLFVPFMNVFYRQTFALSDAGIGSLFAAGSLIMALGMLAAPPLADRLGQIRTVIFTQALSIPFMALLGFAPWLWLSAFAYLVRIILMNMTVPVFQAFAMEQVDEEARATVSALTNIGYSFGYAVSPAISGHLQAQFGFPLVFSVAMVAYALAVAMFWHFFGRRERPPAAPAGLSA